MLENNATQKMVQNVIDGTTPPLFANQLARTIQLSTSGSNAIGWYKIGEILASALSGLTSGSNNYSAILLVNGNGYAGISNAMPSGIIEIDGRVENGSFNATGYPQIKILAGNLSMQSFCVTCSNEKQEIYYLFLRQYERTFFTVISETYGSSVINAMTFDGTYFGSSAPSGATYAINRIYAGFDSAGDEIAAVYAKQSGTYAELTAGKSYRLAQSVKFSAGSVSSGATGWYKVATISGNVLASINGTSSYSATILINGINEPQLSFGALIEIDLRLESSQIVTASNRIQPKILCGGISENNLCAVVDTSANELNVYLLLNNSYAGYSATVIDEEYAHTLQPDETAITLSGAFYSSSAPAGAVYALNVNNAAYDGDGNNIVNTYATKMDLSNPNLLINSNFAINQRGSTSYSSQGYTADRWYKSNSSGTVYAQSTGTRIYGSTIIQYIETNLDLSTEYTISVNAGLTSNTGVYHGSFTTPSSTPTTTTTLYTVSLLSNSISVEYDATKGCYAVAISAATNTNLYVNWVKLEKGPVATMFVAPNISTELLKCQRYYLKYQNRFRIGCIYNGTENFGYSQLLFPVKMRTTPTVDCAFSRILNSASTTIAGSASQMTEEGCVLYTSDSWARYQTFYCTSFEADAEI